MPLMGMGADRNLTTTIGLSSGAYMSMQAFVTHSSWMNGGAFLLGGSWGSYKFLKAVKDRNNFMENIA